MKQFWEKNKVFILGLLASISVVVQQFAGSAEIEWKAIGYAVLMATLSFVANKWRGEYVTITGIVGTLAGVLVLTLQTGKFTWSQFILSAVAALLAAVAPPPKSIEYERSPVIEKAKAQAEVLVEEKKTEAKLETKSNNN